MALPAGRKGVLASELTPEGKIKGGGGGYVLPVASADTLGGVKVGTGLSIEDGVLSASGGGGSTLYLHKIKIKAMNTETGYEIINDSATPFTKDTFTAYYKSIGPNTMLFHHAEASSSKLTIYVIDCSGDAFSNVKIFDSTGGASSSAIQTCTDTVTAL